MLGTVGMPPPVPCPAGTALAWGHRLLVAQQERMLRSQGCLDAPLRRLLGCSAPMATWMLRSEGRLDAPRAAWMLPGPSALAPEHLGGLGRRERHCQDGATAGLLCKTCSKEEMENHGPGEAEADV